MTLEAPNQSCVGSHNHSSVEELSASIKFLLELRQQEIRDLEALDKKKVEAARKAAMGCLTSSTLFFINQAAGVFHAFLPVFQIAKYFDYDDQIQQHKATVREYDQLFLDNIDELIGQSSQLRQEIEAVLSDMKQ